MGKGGGLVPGSERKVMSSAGSWKDPVPSQRAKGGWLQRTMGRSRYEKKREKRASCPSD